MLKYVLFDLDGTITDPQESITRSAAYALEQLGIAVTDLDSLKCFIGPPLTECFRMFYGMNAEQSLDGLRLYRKHYAIHGMNGNVPYDGIRKLLQSLKKAGKTVILATSKPVEYAREILECTELIGYFDFVAGNDLKESRPTKGDVIAYVLAHYPEINGENAVMVGDRMYDILGAHAYDLPCVAVLYGYGTRAELEEHGAETIVATVSELSEALRD